MKITINHLITGEPLLECDAEDVEAAVTKAVSDGANLRYANLRGANLGSAKLWDAKLRCANLRGANLRDANLRGVKDIISPGRPDRWFAFGWLQDGYLAIRAGCRNKRLAEARAYWSETHPEWKSRQEVAAAVDYIEAVARLRGWAIEKETS